MRAVFSFLIVGLGHSLFAQNCNIELAKELLQKEQYAVVYSMCLAIDDCSDISDLDVEWAHYHKGYCAMQLFNDEAPWRLQMYLTDYPDGQFVNQAYLTLSKIYHRNKQFEKAIETMKMVDPFQLEKDEEAMFYFRLGYAHFSLEQYDASSLAFYDIDKVKFSFSDLTTYCLGHIAYVDGNYATAVSRFKKLLNTPMLGQISSYYISQIYYYQERYQDLIDFAKPLLENSINKKRDGELIRLIASAHYGLDEYALSVEFFQRFIASYGSLERSEKYYLADAYFQLKEYDQAVLFFDDLLTENDTLAQYAAHQLANTYLKQDEQLMAINAFKFASQLDFDYGLKEDAFFNLVKLVYQNQDSYENSIDIIEAFIDEFPMSANVSEAKDLLIKAYTTTNDYQSAVDNLSQIESLSMQQKLVYQKLSYYLGLEYYLNKDYQKAISWFETSLEQSQNTSLVALSNYWMAEAYYQLSNFNKAVELFSIFLLKDGAFLLDEYKDAQYALAYSYFQSTKYSQSTKWFRKFLKNSSDSIKLTDANLRLGDAYYMQRDYRRAQAYYLQATMTGTFDVDYALYQQSLCFGLNNQNSKKRQVLTQIIDEFSNSIYHDDALMDLSVLYLHQGDQKTSIELLNQLIESHPTSPLVKLAFLKIGLNHYNNNNIELAISTFKQVVEDYPNSIQAKEALTAYKNIAVEQGSVKPYFDYVEGLSNISVDIAAKDSLSFEAAENLYLNQKCDKAVTAFDDYLESFSQPLFKLKAHFYKAECLFDKSPQLSVDDYLGVLEFPNNEFMERSLSRLARISFEKQEFGTAALHYTSLLEIAQDNNIKREATINLFISYQELNLEANALSYAQLVLNIEKLSIETECRARLFVANYQFSNGELHLAQKNYAIVAQNTALDMASQAQYQLAYLAFLKDDFEASETAIFALSESYFNDYFIAKGFILLADIYLKKENYFQAKATLRSIVENYDGDDELISMCLTKIADIEAIEEQQKDNIQNRELIIDLLNDVELGELFEEETISDDE